MRSKSIRTREGSPVIKRRKKVPRKEGKKRRSSEKVARRSKKGGKGSGKLNREEEMTTRSFLFPFLWQLWTQKKTSEARAKLWKSVGNAPQCKGRNTLFLTKGKCCYNKQK